MTAREVPDLQAKNLDLAGETPLSGRPAHSYVDVELTRDGMNLFERQGDGQTAALVNALRRYGLHLTPRVSSPCG